MHAFHWASQWYLLSAVGNKQCFGTIPQIVPAVFLSHWLVSNIQLGLHVFRLLPVASLTNIQLHVSVLIQNQETSAGHMYAPVTQSSSHVLAD